MDLDERGLIQAVVGGVQDRLEDLRSYTSNLESLYTPGAFPQTSNNAVLVTLTSEQGKEYTRSLSILSDTPEQEGTALTQWAAQQLGVDVGAVADVRYGVDRLRLIDVNTLGYLAATLGTILYQSSLVPDSAQAAMQEQLVSTWFPRLKIKGTIQSFEVLGRILGFDDVRMTPLWSRVSLRRPEDVGNPQNDPDFAEVPEYVPQQTLSPFYNPLETRDGPFFAWSGTVSHSTSSTQFYSQVINGFSPFIAVDVVASQHGTVVHPATGSYALAGGDAYTAARVIPAGSGIQFRALIEGAAYNGLYVHVTSGTEALAVVSVTDRLSAVKYRSSYFDLGLTADMDHVVDVFGDAAVKPNKDLAAGSHTVDGAGTSPFRPWVGGSVALPLLTGDWMTRTVETSGSVTVLTRHQAGASVQEREINIQELTAAGVQAAQALEEVRPATRFPRRTTTGFLIDDTVPYAFYGTQATLLTTNSVAVVYTGSYSVSPLPDYVASLKIVTGIFFRVYWPSTVGVTYHVDFSPWPIAVNALTGWTQIATVMATGPVADYYYALTSVGMAFFRVRVEGALVPPFSASAQIINGKLYSVPASVDPSNDHIWHYKFYEPLITNVTFTGSYDFDTGRYWFNFSPPISGSKLQAYWTMTSTDAVRPEPSFTVKRSGAIAALARPEDDEGVCNSYGSEFVNGTSYFGTFYRCLGYETIDEYPWRRDIVNGGETVEVDAYLPVAADLEVQPVDAECVFADHTGCEYSVYAIKSTVNTRFRYRVEPRPTDNTYRPGSMPIGYQGTFKNLTSLSPTDLATVNSLNDAETLMNPGYKLFHVGLAQGVLVADAPKFFGPHHRQNLIAWLPFNEHPEDALEVVDHSSVRGTQYHQIISFGDRQWDDTLGWYLNMPPGATITSPTYRDWADDQTVSFWYKAPRGAGEHTVVEAGVIRFDYDAAAQAMRGYVGEKLVGSHYVPAGQWGFVYIRKTRTAAWFGAGESLLAEFHNQDSYNGVSGVESLDLYAGESGLGLHDLRVWNACKTAQDMDLVRYHAPTPTLVNYPIGFMYTANQQDRYGLLVLPSGWVTTGDMPAWVRRSQQAVVRRYDEMGLYTGQSRFKETGLGGGHRLPALYQLGVQYGAMTANGTAVVATEHGALPGTNELFLSTFGAGTHVSSGTSPLGNWLLDLELRLPVISSNESGNAYYPANDSVFVVRNSPQAIYEFTASGVWLRTITLSGFSDTEAICYVSGTTFAVADEDLSTITVFPILPSTTAITRAHWLNIDTGLGNLDVNTGGGFEGLTYDSRRDVFWVAKERQSPSPAPGRVGMRMYTVSWSGSVSEPFLAYMVLPPRITDISDIHYDRFNDHIYVLSDEAKAIIDMTTEGEVLEVTDYPKGLFQPEGLTFDTSMTRMWVSSETDGGAPTNKTFRRYVKAAVNAFGTLVPLAVGVESGTYAPWPNVMHETNPCCDRIWLRGQDNYVYEVVLDGTLASTLLSTKRISWLRTDAEIRVNPVYDALLSTGTYYTDWTTGWMNGTLVSSVGTVTISGTGGVQHTTLLPLSYLSQAEQPTGAEVTLRSNGTYLTVGQAGNVTLGVGGTDADTPPLYMYCNSRIRAFALDLSGTVANSAWSKWTDRGNNPTQQHVDVSPLPSILNSTTNTLLVPVRGNAGYIEFEQAGPLSPGRYSLKVESGNIGQPDEDFDGFNTEITINSAVLTKRLLADQTGFNVRGFDTFEFDLLDGVAGNYLISFLWSNPYTDEATNTKRQLAIYSYELRRLVPELYRVNIGLTPVVTLLDTANYNAATPGGWLLGINSYGTLASAGHESVTYPANDTVVSREPLSNILTGDTCHKREDIVMPSGEFVVPQQGSFSYPVITSVIEAPWNEPRWMTSGGITPEGEAVVTAQLRTDTDQARVVLCTQRVADAYGTEFSGDLIYSAMQQANTGNSHVVRCPVSGLSPNQRYFYAVEADGSIYQNFAGTFTTWDRGTRSFRFVLAADENSTALVSSAWPALVSSDPLFMLNCGDLHYSNIATNTPSAFYNAYTTVFSTGTRRDCFARMPFAYVWDDHDYGPDNTDKYSVSRPAARAAYRQAVPHYQLPAGDDAAIYYAFQVGRAYFIVTDLRSERDASVTANYLGKTMLGVSQKAWFKAEVLKANADPNIAVIFWVTSVPWGGAPAVDDHWASYNDERIELSSFFKANRVTRLFFLFGDEHRQSIDDGRHTDWAAGTYGSAGTGHGWPSFNGAPLGQNLSSKAGPYFIGPMGMSNPAFQFGLVTVLDYGSQTYVNFRGVNETGATVSSAGTNMLWQFNGTESPRPAWSAD